MNYLIVTNNPGVSDKFEDVLFTEGSYEDVLVKVRNLIHQGYELISHPMAASIRMIFSSYRSVIIGKKNEQINPFHIETIESSIINYRKLTEGRNIDISNARDYAAIDIKLLEDTIDYLKST